MAIVNINHHRLSQLHTLRFSIEVSQSEAVGVILRECGLPDSVKELVIDIRYSPSFFLSGRSDDVVGIFRMELGMAKADVILASHVSKGRDSSPKVRVKIHITHQTWDIARQTSVKEDIGHHLESMFPLVWAAGLLITE